MNNVDITSVQHLIDVRNQLDQYAAPDKVDWHIACINNRWTKRALAVGGFGYPTPSGNSAGRWKPIFSVAEIGGSGSAAAAAQQLEREQQLRRHRRRDTEQGRHPSYGGTGEHMGHEAESNRQPDSNIGKKSSASQADDGKVAVVHGLNLPLFHIDLTSALESAVANVELREAAARKVENLICLG